MATVPQNEVIADSDERTKPPFLRRVRIRGYKSIAYCDVVLQPLTVLVGRNASGKSNFLDALAFLCDLMELRVVEAVNERKGWRSIFCRNSSNPYIEIGLEATYLSNNSIWDADYSFSVEIDNQNQIRVRQENLILKEQGRGRRCGYRVTGEELEWIGSEHFEDDAEWTKDQDLQQSSEDDKLEDPRFFRRHRFDRLLLSVIGTQPFLDLALELRTSCVYNFSPPAIRIHQPITASPILVRDGGNLARAIEGLREIEPETVQRIGEYLQVIVPGVRAFRTLEYGDFETIRFSLEAKAGQASLEFDASSMSDGTLRVLAALIAAFQIVLPSGFPGFIGIEEPETSLHPAAAHTLVSALEAATERTQVLLTTHSGDLLADPKLSPSSVLVVRQRDGRTEIAPVDLASREIIDRELYSLADLHRLGQLNPDEEHLERQKAATPEE